MTPVRILGVGVCASGMAQWQTAKAILRGEAPWHPEPLPKLDVPLLPVVERRRINATSRAALRAALDAVAALPPADLSQLASVFASADGDGLVLASTLTTLAEHAGSMSPTLFHNSVFNAPAGYWAIASGSRASSTSVSAGPGSLAAGLLETVSEVSATNRAVLLVAVDLPFPHTLESFAITGDAFACALLLAPTGQHGAAECGTIDASLRHEAARDDRDQAPDVAATLRSRFAGNSAALALPLLAAIARGTARRVTLGYLDDCALDLAYRP